MSFIRWKQPEVDASPTAPVLDRHGPIPAEALSIIKDALGVTILGLIPNAFVGLPVGFADVHSG